MACNVCLCECFFLPLLIFVLKACVKIPLKSVYDFVIAELFVSRMI